MSRIVLRASADACAALRRAAGTICATVLLLSDYLPAGIMHFVELGPCLLVSLPPFRNLGFRKAYGWRHSDAALFAKALGAGKTFVHHHDPFPLSLASANYICEILGQQHYIFDFVPQTP